MILRKGNISAKQILGRFLIAKYEKEKICIQDHNIILYV